MYSIPGIIFEVYEELQEKFNFIFQASRKYLGLNLLNSHNFCSKCISRVYYQFLNVSGFVIKKRACKENQFIDIPY